MSADTVTGGDGMAGAGWHLAVTGGGGGGLQTSGDGTVGVGAAKGSDGGIQTSDDGEQQVGGDAGQPAGRGDRPQAAAICHLLQLVTASRLLPSHYHPSSLVGSPLSSSVTTSRPITTRMAPSITASVWTVTANCMPTGGLACF